MASEEGIPPDPGIDIFYKCHPKVKVTTVVCLICENVYHRSDFKKLKNTKWLGNALVLCPDHEGLIITSKKDELALTQTAKNLIAQIKMKQTENIRDEYLQDIINNTNNMDIDTTTETEQEQLVLENTLLKQLVTELKDKNKLLNDIVNKNKLEEVSTKPTFSQVLSAVNTKPKKIPKIIIKKKNQDDKNNLKKFVTYYLTKTKTVQTKKIFFKNANEIQIDCMNETSAKETEKILKEKISTICNIEKEEVKKPRMKIVGLDNFDNMDEKTIEADINERNFKNLNQECRVLHKFDNPKSKVTSILIEVSSEIYKHIKENKSRIFIGYQNCKVYDDINVRPCYNCGRYGHSGSKCNNKKTCLKCSGPHNTIHCKSTRNLCCANCDFHNNKYKTEYNTEHMVNDSECCQILKAKIKKYINNTDYPLSPTIQRFIGKVDTFISKDRTEPPTTISESAESLLTTSPSNSADN